MNLGATNRFRSALRRGFTLTELLVVIGIIGIVTAIAIPVSSSFGKSNAMTAAARQLQDDVAFAKARAINTRSTVYIVFSGPGIGDSTVRGLVPSDLSAAYTNISTAQFQSYALYSERSVGEQPGLIRPRYLSEWKFLPEGVFVAEIKFRELANPDDRFTETAFLPNRAFGYRFFPVPTSDGPPVKLPYIAFNAQGQLISESYAGRYQDVSIPLARGTVDYATDGGGGYLGTPKQEPFGNSVSNFYRIHIEWLTGRGRIDKPELN